jgi:hypothetical protein
MQPYLIVSFRRVFPWCQFRLEAVKNSAASEEEDHADRSWE